jgi:hypothetical protein
VQLLGVESKAIIKLTTFVHQAPFHKLQATLEQQGTNTTLQNTNCKTRCANHKLTKFKWTNHKAENQIMQIALSKPPTTTQIKSKKAKWVYNPS